MCIQITLYNPIMTQQQKNNKHAGDAIMPSKWQMQNETIKERLEGKIGRKLSVPRTRMRTKNREKRPIHKDLKWGSSTTLHQPSLKIFLELPSHHIIKKKIGRWWCSYRPHGIHALHISYAHHRANKGCTYFCGEITYFIHSFMYENSKDLWRWEKCCIDQ